MPGINAPSMGVINSIIVAASSARKGWRGTPCSETGIYL